ncbi:MAG: helix-turn-helix domain-containing protein [archaeon]
MKIDTSVLEDIGMTNSQVKVYLTLLELEEAKSGEIISKSKLQSSVVYNALNQLTQKGLVSFISKGQIKHFFATDPKSLISYVEDKKNKVKELVPKLIKKREFQIKQEAQVFSGWKGIYFAFNKILEILTKGSEYIAWGAGFEEQYTEEAKKFFHDFQKKRADKKYLVKIIVNENSRKQVEGYDWYPKFGKPEYRYVPGFSPKGTVIFGDNVLIVAFEETPIAVLITSKTIAESHRKAFHAMWKLAKK